MLSFDTLPFRFHSALVCVAEDIALQGHAYFAQSFTKKALLTSARRGLCEFHDALYTAEEGVEKLFAFDPENDRASHDLARLFTRWREAPPSFPALMCVFAEKLRIEPEEPAFKAALMTAIAADIENANPYHGNGHFREVAAMMALLCKMNNDAVAVKLDSGDMAKCLMAAAAHDLLHDGKGNAPGGVHVQYRLEDKAIAAIEPFMALAGLSPKDREDVRVLIRVTDVTAQKGGVSPHKILRALLRGETVDVPAELAPLANDPKLLQMAAMMSDADLSPSAATNYIYLCRQTALLSRENPAIKVTDEGLSGFLTHIIEREFCSVAARRGLQSALGNISAKVAARLKTPRR